MRQALAIVAVLTTSLVTAGLSAETAAPAAEPFAALPLRFEENLGQADPRVRFLARGPGYGLLLTQTDATLVLGGTAQPGRGGVVRMRLVGANPAAEVVGGDRLAGQVNSYRGKDPSRWRSGIPTYARVAYRSVYPGIDLVYYGSQGGHLEYDLIVAASAEPGVIAMAFEGVDGLALESSGRLTLQAAGGELSLEPPHVYQETDGGRRSVTSRYVLPTDQAEGRLAASGPVRIEVGAYDPSRPLVIDPVLVYSSFLGGSGSDSAYGVAVDPTGHIYVAGSTDSLDFPTPDPPQASTAGIFVAKLTPDGSALVYSTFLGGTGDVWPGRSDSIAVDCQGNAYVAGYTAAPDFPTLNALQPVHAGLSDAVLAKLDPAGALVFSTYLGGARNDGDGHVAADCAGSVYVAGQTSSPDFPTARPLRSYAGGFDAFVARIAADGSAFVYSTFLGGFQDDALLAFAIDPAGNAYVAGATGSTGFPTVNALQPGIAGREDVFVSELNPDGSALVYSTFLGGSDQDAAWGIAVDAAGNAYVTGRTASRDFPTANPLQSSFGGGFDDVFVAKIKTGGSMLLYSTFLGGSDEERGLDIAVGPTGSAYVTGFSQSPDFPLANPIDGTLDNLFQKTFVTKLTPGGAGLLYSTYFSAWEAWSIALDRLGTAYIAGETSTSIPLRRPLQPVYGGGSRDAFVARINAEVLCLGQEATILGTAGNDVLVGTRGRNVIVGLEGDDVVFGGDGNDLICAGPGNNLMFGGDGIDACFGGPGIDRAVGCEVTAGIP